MNEPPTTLDEVRDDTGADERRNTELVTSGIAVVILTYRQKQQTLRCLNHLLATATDDVPFRVLLWDNGSNDDTAEAVAREFPSVRVHVSETNLGVAGGRNAAAAEAISLYQPEFLLFLDNDMVVEPGFVTALWRPFQDPSGEQIGQTQAKLRLGSDPQRLNDGGGCRIQFWSGRTRPVGYGEVDHGQYDTPTRCVSCGGAMMVRSPLFQELGGFDEIFNPFGPEDLDFSLRLQENGWEAWYVPQAMAYHDVTHTFGGGNYTEEYAALRSRHWLRLMRRHARIRDWIGFVLVGIPVIAARVIGREVGRGNLGALRGLIRGVLGRQRK
jgi:GT2 family glycosyltransferase